jgi:hypothetical protein
LAFLTISIVPVVLVFTAFVIGFSFKPTRILFLLMPLMIFGVLGGDYENRHIYALFMVPYAILSAIVVIHWIYQRSFLGGT